MLTTLIPAHENMSKNILTTLITLQVIITEVKSNMTFDNVD